MLRKPIILHFSDQEALVSLSRIQIERIKIDTAFKKFKRDSSTKQKLYYYPKNISVL